MTDGALTVRSASITVVAQTAARAIGLTLVIVSTAVVTRALSVDQYADWVTVLSLVAMIGFLLDPSISPVVVRRLAQEPEVAPTPAGLIGLRLALGVTALVLLVGIAWALRGSDAAVLGLVLGGQVVPRSLVLNATPWLQVDHRLHRQAVLEALMAALGLAALSTAALLDAPPTVLGLAGFLVPTTVLAVLMAREVRLAPSSRRPPPGPQRPRVRAVLREAAPLAVALALTAAYTRLNTVFVNIASETGEVARYLFAFQFVEQLIVISGIVAGALLPMLASRPKSRELLSDALTRRVITVAATLGALGSAVLVALSPVLVTVIGGPTLDGAERFLQLLAPMAAVLLTALLMGAVYLAAGLGPRYLWFSLAALAFNLAANAALTLPQGADPAARIAWLTEGLVLGLALVPVARSGAAGRAATLHVAVLLAIAVAAAELAGNGVLEAWQAGALAGAATLALGGRALLELARRIAGR